MVAYVSLSIEISLQSVPVVAIDNKSALVNVAWHLADNKQLQDPLMIQFWDRWIRNHVSMFHPASIKQIRKDSSERLQ